MADRSYVYTAKDYNEDYPYECLECGFRGCNNQPNCPECNSKEYLKLHCSE